GRRSRPTARVPSRWLAGWSRCSRRPSPGSRASEPNDSPAQSTTLKMMTAHPETLRVVQGIHDTVVTVVHDTVAVPVNMSGQLPPSAWDRAWPVLLGAVVAIVSGFGAQWFRLFLERRGKRRALIDIMASDLEALGVSLGHASEEWGARKAVSTQSLAVM